MSAYKMQGGWLYRDGKKIFPIGQSYYPSFHYAKYPVPPEGDRMGEMRKDLKAMSDMGFNFIRFATLGETKLEGDTVKVDTPFIDAMIEECQKDDLSVSVRLQGYDVNLRNFEGVRMLDWDGKPQGDWWSDFIRTTYFHPGILEDNVAYARAKAAHYAAFPNVVSTVTYNEPHLPKGTSFDYHPLAIQAYRDYLVKNGHMTAEEARDYEPPRSRKEQGPVRWAMWREFMQESMTEFLKVSADAAREATGLPTYTCLTDAAIGPKCATRGADYFGIAEIMDLSGYNSYIPAQGIQGLECNLLGDLGVCAGEMVGKPAWCIELDARTYIPPQVFNKNVYTLLGAGTKGLVFYQWRGDYPAEGVPHPNSCGFVNYDGTPTNNYENGAKMVALLNRLSDYLVSARRIHTGVGLLRSSFAYAYSDAVDYDREQTKEINHSFYVTLERMAYNGLREAGQLVTITNAKYLKENPCGIKTLLVPYVPYLSQQEKDAVEAFIAAGGKVYECCTERGCFVGGYKPYGKKMDVFDPYLRVRDIPLPEPLLEADHPDALTQVLDGDGWKLITVTNVSPVGKSLTTAIRCRFPVKTATLYSTEGDRELTVQNGTIFADDIADGCVILAKE